MNDATDTSALLADQLDRLLTRTIDTGTLRAAEGGTVAEDLTDAVAALGLDMALVGEARGGAGLSFGDLAGLFEVLGHHAAPLSVGEDILARWAVDHAGLSPRARPSGLAIETLALDPARGTVSGVCVVPWGASHDEIVTVAIARGEHRLVVLPAAAGQRTALPTIGRDPRTRITFHDIPPLALGATDFGDTTLAARLATLRSAQIAGALSRCLALSIDYANVRVQFGRSIGKFQAIQHMIAELAAEAAAAKAGAQLALIGFDAGREDGAAVAKIRAASAATKGAAIAHAVHGAIGVTEEHVLHYLTRRLWQWRDEAGDENFWAERLGGDILSRPGDAFWPRLLALSSASVG